MIQVKVSRDQERRIKAFTIKGHADSGPKGFDLICAGVSSVSFGAVNAVEGLCGFQLIVDQAEDGGYLHCQFPEGIDGSVRQKAELLLEGMIIALKTIETSYSKHIKIIET
jgi:uncharacterized protein